MACAYYHQGGATQTHLRKHTQYSTLVYLHEAKFISFSTSCHLLISSPASSITSTNRKPVIHLDSGARLPAQQKVGILNRFIRCFYTGWKQGWIIHIFGDHCEHVRGEEEKNKAEKGGGSLCRISCQFRWPHIHPFLFLSAVPSVNWTCWIWMYYCLFPPTVSLSQSLWLQSEFQFSSIKYASPAACGAVTISNQQMPPSFAFFLQTG